METLEVVWLTPEIEGLELPPAEEILALFADAEAEIQFWDTRHNELLGRFPEQFVAVHKREVVANDPDLVRLYTTVDELALARKDVWVRFLSTVPRLLIL